MNKIFTLALALCLVAFADNHAPEPTLQKAEELLQNTSAEETVKDAATVELIWKMEALLPVNLAPERPEQDTGKTENDPFPAGLGGSRDFRIPAIITLSDGTVVAAIDARWNCCPDGEGIDTLFSVSNDNGKTWNYSFPNFFNDSDGHDKRASAFIDPVMIQGKDGTIYLMTDLYPAGRYIGSAQRDIGYRKVNGTQRMILYTMADDSQTEDNWSYYVGDFKDGYAPVLVRDTHIEAGYFVDAHYYLYNAEKKPLYCKQVNTDKYVKQNVFFLNAKLHVRNATYLWLITSKDGGQTWSDPTILNPQVRPQADGSVHRFYGVGPGAGLVLSDGTVMLPCYVNAGEYASFIYKNPGEEVWHRSENATPAGSNSSESALVEIDENTVRQFYRDGVNVVRYTDHVRGNGVWKAQQPVRVEEAPKTTWNQMSAIRYNGKINNQDVILVSCATSGNKSRTGGKIYAFAINQDEGHTLTKIGEYQVTAPGVTYGYSSLTQQSNGTIGLLYEVNWHHATYLNIPLSNIIPTAVVDGKRYMSLPLYEKIEDPFHFDPQPTMEQIRPQPEGIVEVSVKHGKVLYTGLKIGTASYEYGGITVNLTVTESSNLQNISLELGGGPFKTPVKNEEIQRNTNDKVAGAKIEAQTVQFEMAGQGHTGSNSQFSGVLEPLAASLYTFSKSGEQWEISAKTLDGSQTWLKAREPGYVAYPYATEKTVSSVTEFNGGFSIKTGYRYLAFWKDGKNSYDACAGRDGVVRELCTFYLYEPAGEQTSSKEIPGYIKSASIKDGRRYLIVSKYNNDYFAMRPSCNSKNKFDHVLKVDTEAESTNAIRTVYLTITPKAVGTTDIFVNGTVYRVTVD